MRVFVFSERRVPVHMRIMASSRFNWHAISFPVTSDRGCRPQLISKMLLETDPIRLNIDYYYDHLLISGSSLAPNVSSQGYQTTKRTSGSFPLSARCFRTKVQGKLPSVTHLQSEDDLWTVRITR